MMISQIPDDGHRIRHHHGHQRVDIDTRSNAMNCTVAYMSQCMSVRKCRDSCQSMGAASFRWFDEYACCECIGNTCLNFGKGECLRVFTCQIMYILCQCSPKFSFPAVSKVQLDILFQGYEKVETTVRANQMYRT